jgi:hypothetical protein
VILQEQAQRLLVGIECLANVQVQSQADQHRFRQVSIFTAFGAGVLRTFVDRDARFTGKIDKATLEVKPVGAAARLA